jgi:two-component system chemotaxis sensor kinase CheA
LNKKSELQPELLEDFFGEADEHLTIIRNSLARLESSLGKPLEAADTEELFRRFHSFKGIASIVGLVAAENLAHATEELLRSFRAANSPFNQRDWNLLLQSAEALDQMVLAFRSDKTIPLFRDLAIEIASQPPGSPPGAKPDSSNTGQTPANPSSEANATLAGSGEEGYLLWRCRFTPSHELDDRGINVNSVRAKLESAGTIIRSEPKVTGKNLVSFEFILRARETPDDIASWEASGITVDLIEDHSTPATPARENAQNVSSTFSMAAPCQILRVELRKMDELMRILGGMVIQKSRFDQLLHDFEARKSSDPRLLQEMNQGFGRSIRELRQAIMEIRLVPVAEIFARMPFVIRDLARETGKKARLILEGQQTAIDKYLIERLKEPLLHLVRNAFAHGIELPSERLAAGKPEEAIIVLKASTISDSVLIQVRDDGRGIDRKAVARKAAAAGIPVPQVLDDTAILQILATPGFSTRDKADLAAGRGVGMSVVLNTVRELGGNLDMETRLGHGAQFTLRMPLTVAIAEAFILSAGGQTWALPQNYVGEILKIDASDIRMVNRQQVVKYRDGALPIQKLSETFSLAAGDLAHYFMLTLVSERGSAGLLVEKIHGQKEIVVRALRDPLLQVEGIAGAAELGDGKPVLILDPNYLLKGAVRPV